MLLNSHEKYILQKKKAKTHLTYSSPYPSPPKTFSFYTLPGPQNAILRQVCYTYTPKLFTFQATTQTGNFSVKHLEANTAKVLLNVDTLNRS